ncbi:hypothetical protein ARMSODRAFT_515899 [Armillaria solidipes]|uniref:Uncharacterized protein n=1 Tax=Armillaria solidipes TaxID=1076256 RepID=A0A2H3B588_9AGAR|nr:hypothetical protein ARMSODRAFT_515899 [Armillaria solidipes]
MLWPLPRNVFRPSRRSKMITCPQLWLPIAEILWTTFPTGQGTTKSTNLLARPTRFYFCGWRFNFSMSCPASGTSLRTML